MILALMFAGTVVSAEQNRLGLRTVIIDAGHGGKDPGAVSKDRATYEKSLTFDIANRLAAGISDRFPELKVVRTRQDDRFVSLASRAEIANRENGDLFISIHINSAKSTQPNGYSVHVLGDSQVKNRDLFAYNMDVCQRENSVILLEDDYSTRYQGFNPSDPESYIFMQLMQNSHLEQSLELAQMIAVSLKEGPIGDNRGVWQNPFYVLWKTSMPAVLVELGFISNDADLSVLRSRDKRGEIVECILAAFCRYKKDYDRSMMSVKDEQKNGPDDGKKAEPEGGKAAVTTIRKTTVADTVKKEMPRMVEPAGKAEIIYGTQIFAGRKRIPDDDKIFLGYKPTVIKVGDLYKYIIGTSSDKAQAYGFFEQIRRSFPTAFPVCVEDGKILKYTP